jgi:acetyltransferase-like isoleucine patch superfamily enzyme|tara:strand:+ start:1075 stop:1776 length:702 start_codon:yes stop_codon:yes gene_type:complete
MLWKITQNVLTTIVVLYTAIHWGIACIPGIFLVLYTFELTNEYILFYRATYIGISLGLAYVMWMLATILITSILGFIFKPSIDNVRVPFLSFTSVRWAFLNVIDRLAKPCVHHMVPSWITDFYYRALGCKIGKDCFVSSDRINDPYLVTIGDNSIIGSKVIITPHLAEKNDLVLSPITIGNNCLIGLGAQINPGCVIGDGAVIASRAIVPKYTNIPAGEVWAGIPAKKIKKKN